MQHGFDLGVVDILQHADVAVILVPDRGGAREEAEAVPAERERGPGVLRVRDGQLLEVEPVVGQRGRDGHFSRGEVGGKGLLLRVERGASQVGEFGLDLGFFPGYACHGHSFFFFFLWKHVQFDGYFWFLKWVAFVGELGKWGPAKKRVLLLRAHTHTYTAEVTSIYMDGASGRERKPPVL